MKAADCDGSCAPGRKGGRKIAVKEKATSERGERGRGKGGWENIVENRKRRKRVRSRYTVTFFPLLKDDNAPLCTVADPVLLSERCPIQATVGSGFCGFGFWEGVCVSVWKGGGLRCRVLLGFHGNCTLCSLPVEGLIMVPLSASLFGLHVKYE